MRAWVDALGERQRGLAKLAGHSLRLGRRVGSRVRGKNWHIVLLFDGYVRMGLVTDSEGIVRGLRLVWSLLRLVYEMRLKRA